ncbi:MAG: hypothetical protein AAFV25_04950 [Bacteroidota bacterium]
MKSTIKWMTTSSAYLWLIALGFLFIWIDFVVDSGHFVARLPFLSSWSFIVGGLLIPFILLVAAAQYNSSLAYGTTMFIFGFVLLENLSYLPYYYGEYLYQPDVYIEFTRCYCCAICEMESIIGLSLICLTAIFLMNQMILLERFKWKRKYSLVLLTLVLLLFYTWMQFRAR